MQSSGVVGKNRNKTRKKKMDIKQKPTCILAIN